MGGSKGSEGSGTVVTGSQDLGMDEFLSPGAPVLAGIAEVLTISP